MKIGVFDSGIGGLSVLKSLRDSGCFSEIFYYGDTARVPYGVKDSRTIVRFSLEALEVFKTQNIKMLVVACNTVSAYALCAMQDAAPYPVVGVIESGVLSLSQKVADKRKKILIIATKATINSGIYEARLREMGYENIVSLQTGFLVPLVEEGVRDSRLLESVFDYYFGGLRRRGEAPDAIILGCTHFPFLAEEIRGYFGGRPTLIHSGEAIVDFLVREYALKRGSVGLSAISYHASGDVDSLKKYAKEWLRG